MPETDRPDELAQFASDLQLMRDRALNLHLDPIVPKLDWAIWMVEITRVNGFCPNCKSGPMEIYER